MQTLAGFASDAADVNIFVQALGERLKYIRDYVDRELDKYYNEEEGGDQEALALAIRHLADEYSVYEWEPVAREIVTRVTENSDKKIGREIGRLTGVDLASILKPSGVRKQMESNILYNTSLIKSVPLRVLEDVQFQVVQGAGKHGREKLNYALNEIFIKALNRLKLIGRDQSAKLTAAVQEKRAQGLGITHYVWRTADDSRVSDEHRSLNGKTFAYADPPLKGNLPDGGNPGDRVNCRCYAEPIIPADWGISAQQ